MKKDTVLTIVQQILTFGGGFAVSGGYAIDSEVTTIIGGIIGIAGAVWTIIARRKAGAGTAEK